MLLYVLEANLNSQMHNNARLTTIEWFYLFRFGETPRKFIIAELSIRKLGSSSLLIIAFIIRNDEDPSLRIESSAIINIRGVSTKLQGT